MDITIKEAAKQLRHHDHILILSHRAPDGDTLGCAAALAMGLASLQKQVRFACSDEVPKKFADLFSEVSVFDPAQPNEDFRAGFLVSVDIAARNLFGDALSGYPDQVDLCIDHHQSNDGFARQRCLDATAAATGEIIYALLRELQVPIHSKIADCLYTAISTDTGCFKYPNTTSRTLRIAADLVDAGANAADINRRMFDTVSKARLALERLALERLEYHFGGRCVSMDLPRALMEETGAKGSDLDGITSLPRQIEGALLGITIRERKDGGYKLSLRGQPPVDCAAVCERFGGGGHRGAAGCTFDTLPLEEVKRQILTAAGEHLLTLGLLHDAP